MTESAKPSVCFGSHMKKTPRRLVTIPDKRPRPSLEGLGVLLEAEIRFQGDAYALCDEEQRERVFKTEIEEESYHQKLTIEGRLS